jgi:hypothetical protein
LKFDQREEAKQAESSRLQDKPDERAHSACETNHDAQTSPAFYFVFIIINQFI